MSRTLLYSAALGGKLWELPDSADGGRRHRGGQRRTTLQAAPDVQEKGRRAVGRARRETGEGEVRRTGGEEALAVTMTRPRESQPPQGTRTHKNQSEWAQLSFPVS